MEAREVGRHLVIGLAGLALVGCAPLSREDADAGDPGVIDGGFADAWLTVDGNGGGGVDCNLLHATVRDFQDNHPDFERPGGDYVRTGIVQAMLGADHKPVYASTGGTDVTSGPDQFVQWYNDVAGVNQAIAVDLTLTPADDGRFVYDSDAFFPIDGEGFGNQGREHNFHFTTEIHTSFTYQGGESFTFRGDDDLWLFINDRLVIDLGGVHSPATQKAVLDDLAGQLGIEVGGTYPMDIFHAERHTVQSTFHIETTIDCLIVG